MQSHITCKLDPNKWIYPILSCQKVYVKNCSTNGLSCKCWRKLTRGEGGSVKCWPLLTRGGGVYEPPNLADVICEQPYTLAHYVKITSVPSYERYAALHGKPEFCQEARIWVLTQVLAAKKHQPHLMLLSPKSIRSSPSRQTQNCKHKMQKM